MRIAPYPASKPSGVGWLGAVPGHWDILPGRSCFALNHTPNNDLIETTVLSLSYGQIKIRPEERLHGLVPQSFETYQIVGPADIICRPTDLQNDQTSLRFGLSQHRGIITSAYMCLRTHELLISSYGYILLHTYDSQKVFYGLGSGLRQNLSWSDFKYLSCVVPPRAEQAAIVRYLDDVGRRIRRYVSAKRKLIALLEEEKQAVINQAVTRGLDPNVRLKPSGVEWLGDVPEHWEVRRLKRVLHRLIDCEHKTAPAVSASSYRVVRTSAVRGGSLSIAGTYCTSEKAFAEWTRRGNLEPGDVIFTREAPAGEACVVPSNLSLCLGQRTVLMKVDRNAYDPHFLVHMLYAGSPHDEIALASRGSTVPHFNVEDIGVLSVLTPPVPEQTAIVRYLDHETAVIDTAIARARRQVELLEEYRTRLIADVVTGKLDVREAAARLPDEPDDADRSDADGEAEDLGSEFARADAV